MLVLEKQSVAWKKLLATASYWFHNPDPITIRAALAVPAALNLSQACTWLMIIGPSSSGKTELHFPIARAYSTVIETSDVNVPGLLSLGRGHKGEGALKRLGVKGLWLIKDFGSIIAMREEKRNELLAAMREIFDGSWSRDTGRGREPWTGLVNIVAAATPAIERAYKVNQELGSRFIHIRLSRPSGDGVREKATRQAGKKRKMEAELKAVSQELLTGMSNPDVSEEWRIRIYDAAEMIAYGRTPVIRDRSRTILDVGDTEGAPRVYQELLALILGDAALHGQEEVEMTQLPLLKRLTFNTMPAARGLILQTLADAQTSLRRAELFEMAGVGWDSTFSRTLDELRDALHLIEEEKKDRGTFFKLAPMMSKMAQSLM